MDKPANLRKTTYTSTRTFRITGILSDQLSALANRVNRHESDIIRQAVFQYVAYYTERPDDLRKWT